MIMISKGEISHLINDVYQAVEESRLGKIAEIKEGKLTINAIPYNAFLYLLSGLCPKSVEASGSMEMREPMEPWQK